MSALFNETTRAAGDAAGATPLTTGAAIVLIALVLILLVEHEVARPLLSPAVAARTRSLAFVVVPLIAAVVVVLAARIEEILR